jgi:hypothetical protein
LVDASIWTRKTAAVAPRRARPIEHKESARWLAGCEAAAHSLRGTASITMVADRESDLYLLFARKPAGLDLIVRAGQDRTLATGGHLFTALTGQSPLLTYPVRVAPRGPGDKGRLAQVAVRAGSVQIARPRNGNPQDGPETITLTLLSVEEIDPPAGKTALVWHLLTTHTIADAAQARETVELYRLRWRIEQLFRALKSDGLGLDDSQLVDAERMFNLAAIALAAAIKTIQLVDARDGSERPDTDVVDATFRPALARLSRSLEGKTARQRNPHSNTSLAFVAWIAARLGGWNCYYKPPGPKTMQDGWRTLAATLHGYALATQAEIP